MTYRRCVPIQCVMHWLGAAMDATGWPMNGSVLIALETEYASARPSHSQDTDLWYSSQ